MNYFCKKVFLYLWLLLLLKLCSGHNLLDLADHCRSIIKPEEKTDVELYLSLFCPCRNCDINSWYNVSTEASAKWESQPATVEGMLGDGFEHMSLPDIKDSINTLQTYVQPKGRVGTKRALDCGAGIGRITKHVLLPIFDQVDMVDVIQKFLDTAKMQYLTPKEVSRIGSFICSPLEIFSPKHAYYNVIWIQGVLEHLNEIEVVKFLKRCKKGLTHKGLIFVKENIADPGDKDSEFDIEYSRVIRSKEKWLQLIEQAQLRVIEVIAETVIFDEVLEMRIFVVH